MERLLSRKMKQLFCLKGFTRYLFVICLMLFLSTGPVLARGTGEFIGISTFTVKPDSWCDSGEGGTSPDKMAVGDYNGDGIADLAVGYKDSQDICSSQSAISILIGDGKGAYTTLDGIIPVVWYSGSTPLSIVNGDFNGDGKLDLAAIAVSNDDGFFVFMGNGDGTFADSVEYIAGGNTRDLVVGDYDSDGDLDIAVSNRDDGNISLFLNDGTGMFLLSFNFPVEGGTSTGPVRMETADFDGDGYLDIVTVIEAYNAAIRLNVIFGDGKGMFTFTPTVIDPEFLTGGQYPDMIDGITVGDFNGDNIDDIAIAINSWVQNKAAVYLGSNERAFSDPVTTPTTFIGNYHGMTADDINEDGDLDLILANTKGNLQTFFGDGTGGFPSQTQYIVGRELRDTAVVDFDGDGIKDIAVVDYDGKNVAVLKGDGTGHFITSINKEVSGCVDDCGNIENPWALWMGASSAMEKGDFNNDGTIDLLITVGDDRPELVTLFGDGRGIFTIGSDTPAGSNTTVHSIIMGDFNNDNIDDAALMDSYDASVDVFFGDGSGNFSGLREFTVRPGPAALDAGDFNGDNNLDIIVACSFGLENQTHNISILIGDGDGNFIEKPYNIGGDHVSSLAVADFNKDGNLDFAATLYDQDTIKVHLGDGTANFQQSYNLYISPKTGLLERPRQVETADFDGDGDLDLAVLHAKWYNINSSPYCCLPDEISIFLGDGTGLFSGPRNLTTGEIPVELEDYEGTNNENVQSEFTIEDFNGDGILDMATRSAIADNISIYLGNGDGTFTKQKKSYKAAGDFRSTGEREGSLIITGDFNSDNIVDILAAPYGEGFRTTILVGISEGPNISVDISTYDYGSVDVSDTPIPQTFIVTSTGNANLIMGTAAITGTDVTEFVIQNDNCSGKTIAPLKSCTIEAVFIPATVGAKTANLSFPSNASEMPTLDVTLTGESIEAAAPDISVDKTSHDFGNVDVGSASQPETFTVSNTGKVDLILNTLNITGTDSADFNLQNDNCSGQTIAPSGSCTVEAVFSPTVKSAESANLSILSNDPDTPTLDVPLSGTGGVSGTCDSSISPTNQTFDSVGGTDSVSVTTDSDCTWTAVSNDSWITIDSGGSGDGDGTVNYTVSENTSTSSRTGTITIEDQTFTVTQSATVGAGGVSAPTGFTASASGDTLTLSWNAASGAEGYYLYYGYSSGNYAGQVNLGNTTGTSFSGIPDGTYYLAVTAYSGTVESDYSDEESVTFSAIMDLSVPTGFTVSASGSTLTLSWNAVSGAEGYKIYYGSSSGDYVGPVDLGNTTGQSFSGIPDGTYYLAVAAYSGPDESGYSSEASVTFSSTVDLSAPAGFTALASGSTLTLSWNAVSGAEGYKVYYGFSSGDYSGSLDLGNTTGQSFSGIPDATYYLAVTAYTSSSESGYSSEAGVIVNVQ